MSHHLNVGLLKCKNASLVSAVVKAIWLKYVRREEGEKRSLLLFLLFLEDAACELFSPSRQWNVPQWTLAEVGDLRARRVGTQSCLHLAMTWHGAAVAVKEGSICGASRRSAAARRGGLDRCVVFLSESTRSHSHGLIGPTEGGGATSQTKGCELTSKAASSFNSCLSHNISDTFQIAQMRKMLPKKQTVEPCNVTNVIWQRGVNKPPCRSEVQPCVLPSVAARQLCSICSISTALTATMHRAGVPPGARDPFTFLGVQAATIPAPRSHDEQRPSPPWFIPPSPELLLLLLLERSACLGAIGPNQLIPRGEHLRALLLLLRWWWWW